MKVVLADVHQAFAKPAMEEKMAILAVCDLHLSAVWVRVGEGRMGFVDRCLTHRVDDESEAVFRESFIELVDANERFFPCPARKVEHHFNIVSHNARCSRQARWMEMWYAASRDYRLFRGTCTVDRSGPNDDPVGSSAHGQSPFERLSTWGTPSGHSTCKIQRPC